MPAVENDSIGIKNVLHPVALESCVYYAVKLLHFTFPGKITGLHSGEPLSRFKSETFLVISRTYGQWPNLTPHIEAIRINVLPKNRVRDLYIGAEEKIT
jgi:hypothetical protein